MTALGGAYAEKCYGWQTRTIEKVQQRIVVDGVDSILKNGLGISGSLPALMNDLMNIRDRISNFGRGQVNEELKRQGGGK